MKTKTAGARKRTVTIVVGPKTVTCINKLLEVQRLKFPGWDIELVDVVGSALNRYMSDLRKSVGREWDDGWFTHFD